MTEQLSQNNYPSAELIPPGGADIHSTRMSSGMGERQECGIRKASGTTLYSVG